MYELIVNTDDEGNFHNRLLPMLCMKHIFSLHPILP